ncbi:MAG TPA: toll/interleukin-1 receptor domain-containing protein [Stellaceae bacterium]|nr:toll/interleukin-1 receptor domain-containing protein [Stellaceae bacterium]
MARKIFISYRRQDTAANALGICQYLEHEFGQKNVFIDVDMRAGTKFPNVLEQRLAECKVMLVLIGPDWLGAKDELGHRRLEKLDDWVRLEVSHALRRNITVIPVLVNGAALPARAELPDNIQGLLDHQAISVTINGFRHEMAGLARDIRGISGSMRGRAYGAVVAGFTALIVVLGAIVMFGTPNFSERIWSFIPFLHAAKSVKPHGLWASAPGEWVMYAFNNRPAAFYFRPDTLNGEDIRG